MGVIAMVAGLAVFVVFVYLGYNRVLMAILGAAVMFLLSGVNILEGLNTSFLPSMGGYVQRFTLLFLTSALFGCLMSEAGTAKRIALSMSRLIRSCKSDKVQMYLCVLFVPFLYFTLTYIGINGFVIAFTVMPIAKSLFEETNTPWRIYTCAGTQTINAAMLSGSLSQASVTAGEACGTGVNGGLKISLIMVTCYTIITLIMYAFLAAKLYRTKEGFFPSGKAISESQLAVGVSEDQLPSLPASLIPLLVVLILNVIAHVNVVVALTGGCLATIAVGFKNLRGKMKKTLASGVVSCYAPLLSVAATVGFGTALKGLQGFSVVNNAFSTMPPLYNGLTLGFFSAFITANATTPSASFGPELMALFGQAGLTMETSEKLICWMACASMSPHNAGFANVEAVMKLPYKEALRNYTLYTYVPAFITIAVAILCINLGIVV